MTFGDQIVDYSDQLLAESIKRKLCIGKAGKHEIQTCDFQLKNSAGVTSRIFTSTEDIQAVMKREGEPYFIGVIRPYVRQKITQKRSEPISLQIMDNTKLLEKTIFGKVDVLSSDSIKEGTVFAQRWTSLELINTANHEKSLVHKLFAAANLTYEYVLDCPFNRSEFFPLFQIKKGEILSEVIETALYEYGLTYRATEAGNFEIIDIAQTTPVAESQITEFYNSLSINRSDIKNDGVTIQYSQLEYQRNQVVWASAASTQNKQNLKYGEIFPIEAKEKSWLIPYSVKDKEIYDIQNLKVTARIGNGEHVDDAVSQWNGSVMPFQLHLFQLDSEGARFYVENIEQPLIPPLWYYHGYDLTELKIVGDVWLASSTKHTISEVCNNPYDYTAKYIFNAENATKLRHILTELNKNCSITYTFGEKAIFDIGSIIEIEDSITAIKTLVRIISRSEQLQSCTVQYECEAVSPIDYTRTVHEIEYAENFANKPTVVIPETLSVDLSSSFFAYTDAFTLKGPQTITLKVTTTGMIESPVLYINSIESDPPLASDNYIISPDLFNSEGFIEIQVTCGELTQTRIISKLIDGENAKYVVVSGESTFKYTANSSIPINPELTLHATLYGGLWGCQWRYFDGTTWIDIDNATSMDFSLRHDFPLFTGDILRLACFSEECMDEITITRVSDGATGSSGLNGKASYLHIKYSDISDPVDASQMNDVDGKYIGQYTDFSSTASLDPSSYTWTRIRGENGSPAQFVSLALSKQTLTYSYDGELLQDQEITAKCKKTAITEEMHLYVGTMELTLNPSGETIIPSSLFQTENTLVQLVAGDWSDEKYVTKTYEIPNLYMSFSSEIVRFYADGAPVPKQDIVVTVSKSGLVSDLRLVCDDIEYPLNQGQSIVPASVLADKDQVDIVLTCHTLRCLRKITKVIEPALLQIELSADSFLFTCDNVPVLSSIIGRIIWSGYASVPTLRIAGSLANMGDDGFFSITPKLLQNEDSIAVIATVGANSVTKTIKKQIQPGYLDMTLSGNTFIFLPDGDQPQEGQSPITIHVQKEGLASDIVLKVDDQPVNLVDGKYTLDALALIGRSALDIMATCGTMTKSARITKVKDGSSGVTFSIITSGVSFRYKADGTPYSGQAINVWVDKSFNSDVRVEVENIGVIINPTQAVPVVVTPENMSDDILSITAIGNNMTRSAMIVKVMDGKQGDKGQSIIAQYSVSDTAERNPVAEELWFDTEPVGIGEFTLGFEPWSVIVPTLLTGQYLWKREGYAELGKLPSEWQYYCVVNGYYQQSDLRMDDFSRSQVTGMVPARTMNIDIKQLPTSADNLIQGDLWVSADGILHIIL